MAKPSLFKQAVQTRRLSIASDKAGLDRMVRFSREAGIERIFNAIHKLEPRARIYVGTYTVRLFVPVISFKHMLEVLEFVQAQTGWEFDKSEDLAYSAERYYYASGHAWFQLVADASGNEENPDATCRRKTVGFKTVEQPIYELECN